MKKKINNPAVTVIIASYNNEKFIKKCLNSILNQTYKKIEIIVVDDCSTDNSIQLLKKFKKKIKLIKNKKKDNIAGYDQMQTYYNGFLKSRGDVIFFLDSDDYYEKNKVKNVLNFFIKNKKENILFDMPIIVKNNKYILEKNKNKIIQAYWPYFPSQSCISVKRNLLKKIFRSIKFKKFPDIHMDFRIAVYSKFLVGKMNILNKNLTYYRQTEGNVSSNFKFLSISWWKRRKQAHEYIIYFFKKNKIKYEKNFDYYLTHLVNFIFNVF
jgi:glycosyltransferase involved in cell wall biosynthesis